MVTCQSTEVIWTCIWSFCGPGAGFLGSQMTNILHGQWDIKVLLSGKVVDTAKLPEVDSMSHEGGRDELFGRKPKSCICHCDVTLMTPLLLIA
jgi:hypothetical protein